MWHFCFGGAWSGRGCQRSFPQNSEELNPAHITDQLGRWGKIGNYSRRETKDRIVAPESPPSVQSTVRAEDRAGILLAGFKGRE